MVTVDHNVNIQRIIDVIKGDSTVFDNGETDGLLRSVEFGDPPNNEIKHFAMPYAYVTTKTNIQSTSYPQGIQNSGNVNTLTVMYDVVIVAQARDQAVNSQKQLYSLMTNLRTVLNDNPTFTDPDDPGEDPIFSRSIVNESTWNSKTKGQQITSITFTIIATIGESLVITIPTFGDLNIISDTGDDGRNNTVIPNDEGNTKRTKGEFVGVRFFEYEYDTTTFNGLETLIEADSSLDLVLKYPSGNVTYPAKLEYQRQSERFDGVRTVFLQVNRETA